MRSKIWITYLMIVGLVGLWLVVSGYRVKWSSLASRARIILGFGIMLLVGKRFLPDSSLAQDLAEAAGLALCIWGFLVANPIPKTGSPGAGATGSGVAADESR